jgi:hypothetical protein
MHFPAVYRNVVKKTVNIISGKKPFTFLFLKCLDDYMSEGMLQKGQSEYFHQ